MDDLVKRARAALDGVTPESWHPEYCENSNVWHIDAGAYPIGTAICECKSDANARFIAAARSLVPDMADRIAALEADLARAEAALAEARVEGLREAAETILTAMERAQIDMTILRKFMNGEPVAALTALARIKEGE